MRLKPGIALNKADRALPKGFHSVMTPGNSFNYNFKKKSRKLRLQVSYQHSEFIYSNGWSRTDRPIAERRRHVLIRPMNFHPTRNMMDFIQIYNK